MNRIVPYISVLLFLMGWTSVPARATCDTVCIDYDSVEMEEILPQQLRRICNDTLAETAQLGVVVCDAETGRTLFSHNNKSLIHI